MSQIQVDNILLVEVPTTAKNIDILALEETVLAWDVAGFIGTSETLPPGSWQFIGTTDEVTEDVAAKIVERQGNGFMDYDKNSIPHIYPFVAALESYSSWLRANNIPTDKRFAILLSQK